MPDTQTSAPSYYERHIFFCLNERKNGEACCAQFNAQEAFDRCKSLVKDAGLSGPGKVRVNKAGCLDRCAAGPVAVVYPEAVWYTFIDAADIEEIVESHLKNGQVVTRLLTHLTLGVETMKSSTRKMAISGPVGALEVAVDEPASTEVRGVVVISHPHPLFGGTMDNKVVQTLARAFVQSGWRAVRFNFRGVGASAGVYDEGRGELEDLLAVIHDQAEGTLALAGFSFGAFVTSHAAEQLRKQRDIEKLVLVGTAASRFSVAPVASELHPRTLVVHGEVDDTVPLASVMEWARPQNLPVTVIPGVNISFMDNCPCCGRWLHAMCRVLPL